MISWLIRFYVFAVRRSKYGPLIAFMVLIAGLVGNTVCFAIFDEQSWGDALWYMVIFLRSRLKQE